MSKLFDIFVAGTIFANICGRNEKVSRSFIDVFFIAWEESVGMNRDRIASTKYYALSYFTGSPRVPNTCLVCCYVLELLGTYNGVVQGVKRKFTSLKFLPYCKNNYQTFLKNSMLEQFLS